MTRRAFEPTRLAAMLQAASLLAVAAGVSGILVNDIIRHRAEAARGEATSQVQLLASPHDGDAKPR